MDTYLYDHDSITPYDGEGDPEQKRIKFRDRDAELTIWFTEAQANALRQALDMLYPPAAPAADLEPGAADAIAQYADEHADDETAVCNLGN